MKNLRDIEIGEENLERMGKSRSSRVHARADTDLRMEEERAKDGQRGASSGMECISFSKPFFSKTRRTAHSTLTIIKKHRLQSGSSRSSKSLVIQ